MAMTLKSEKEVANDQLLSDIDTLRSSIILMWTEEEGFEWLFSSNDALGGRVPIHMIACGRIEELINSLEHLSGGFFT
jgi:hypothetical protein